jgi:hypothetical protein
LNFTETKCCICAVCKVLLPLCRTFLLNNAKMKNLKSQLADATSTRQEPKRLSKAGEWAKAHPKGIFTVIDRRAVNR